MSNKDVVTDEYSLLFGDCLERMKEIPNGSVDMVLTDQYIVDMYNDGRSMREIAKLLNTNHKRISKILKKYNINKRPCKGKGVKKFQCDSKRLYNNMATHLRFNISLDWLLQFKDFDKLKVLNDCITNRDGRFNESDFWYKEYINKFYYDENFNKVYEKWLEFDKMKYLKPSIDHINPRSKGGDNDLNNLQFLTWFENRCKNNLSQEDWNFIKSNIEEFLI